jgi:hypothetical protein
VFRLNNHGPCAAGELATPPDRKEFTADTPRTPVTRRFHRDCRRGGVAGRVAAGRCRRLDWSSHHPPGRAAQVPPMPPALPRVAPSAARVASWWSGLAAPAVVVVPVEAVGIAWLPAAEVVVRRDVGAVQVITRIPRRWDAEVPIGRIALEGLRDPSARPADEIDEQLRRVALRAYRLRRMYSDAESFAFGQPGTGGERTTAVVRRIRPRPRPRTARARMFVVVSGSSARSSRSRTERLPGPRIGSQRTTEPAARTSVRPASERRTRSRTKSGRRRIGLNGDGAASGHARR